MNSLPQSSRTSETRRRRGGSRRRAAKPRKPVPVFIAYGDVPAARCAMSQMAAIIARRDSPEHLQPLLWRFDQLSAPGWREMALRDATHAVAVVIALSDEMPLHAAAEAWLTTLATRHGTHIDVIAVLNEEQWTISLQQTESAGEWDAKAADANVQNGATLVEMPRKKMTARAA